jgi:hypothetical protein
MDVNIFANLIKVWFRELPEGLLNRVGQDAIRAVADDGGAFAASRFVASLAPRERSLMLWLLDLMADVVARHEVNRMKPRALAIVIAPNLYKPDPGCNPIVMMQFSSKVVQCLMACLHWRTDGAYA